jgi:hypothetical protein
VVVLQAAHYPSAGAEEVLLSAAAEPHRGVVEVGQEEFLIMA